MAKPKSYDRIFRETIEQLVVPLANRLLNLSIPALEEILDDLHQTIERKPDFLKKVIRPNEADNYILHFEFRPRTTTKCWSGCWNTTPCCTGNIDYL